MVVLGRADRPPQLHLELLAGPVEHRVAADERRSLRARDDRVDLLLGVVLLVPQHQLEREPGEPRVGLEPLHPPLPRLFEDPQVVLEDVEDGVAARAGQARRVEPRHEALPRPRDEPPELFRPLVLAEEAVVRVEHLVERDVARRRRDRSALRPRLRRARAGGEPEGEVEPVVEDADLAFHAHAVGAIGARLADELLELHDLPPGALQGPHTVGPVVRPEGRAEDGDPPRGRAHLLHRRDHGRVDRGARARLARPRHVDLRVARTRLAHVRLERDLKPEVPGVAAAGQPVDAQLGSVAEDAAAAQGHGEREDERCVLALEIVVDAGLEEEPAQLGERADASVHAGEAAVAAEVRLSARPDADDRRQEILVDADEGRPAGASLLLALVETVIPADEGLPHRGLSHRADRREGIRRRRGLRPGGHRREQDDEHQRAVGSHFTILATGSTCSARRPPAPSSEGREDVPRPAAVTLVRATRSRTNAWPGSAPPSRRRSWRTR